MCIHGTYWIYATRCSGFNGTLLARALDASYYEQPPALYERTWGEPTFWALSDVGRVCSPPTLARVTVLLYYEPSDQDSPMPAPSRT